MNVTPFRLVPEDLDGLERKTLVGLQPLLDALNVTLGQVVAALGGQASEELVSVTLRTGAAVADSFPLLFRTTVRQPRFVAMACNPQSPNHAHATPRVMQGFQLTDAGLVSVPFITGLEPSSTYALTFLVR